MNRSPQPKSKLSPLLADYPCEQVAQMSPRTLYAVLCATFNAGIPAALVHRIRHHNTPPLTALNYQPESPATLLGEMPKQCAELVAGALLWRAQTQKRGQDVLKTARWN